MSGSDEPSQPIPLESTPFSSDIKLDDLRQAMAVFCNERGWERFHTPRNLLLAMTGEVGELAEIFQWRGECAPFCAQTWSERDREHLGEELSDVLLYLVRLSDRCGIDLATAALRKMALNRKKYPADKCFGSSAKYSAYEGKEGGATATASTSSVGEGGERGGGGGGGREEEVVVVPTSSTPLKPAVPSQPQPSPKDASPTERLVGNLDETFREAGGPKEGGRGAVLTRLTRVLENATYMWIGFAAALILVTRVAPKVLGRESGITSV